MSKDRKNPVKKTQQTKTFFTIPTPDPSKQEENEDDYLQQMRTANDQNQSIGFGCFMNSGMNQSSGFQTGGFKQIELDQEIMKKARLLLQSQDDDQDLFTPYGGKTYEYQGEKKEQEKEVDFCFTGGFGFANGFGQALSISPSKLKAAQLLLKSQSQIDDNEKQQENYKSPVKPASKKQKTKLRAESRKIQMTEQKTLPSHRRSFNKLLILQDSVKKSKKEELVANLIEYPKEYQTIKRETFLQQFKTFEINLSQYQKPKYFHHIQKQCLFTSCVFCKQEIEQVYFQQIISILCRKYGKQYEQQFTQWYHQVTFKLFKYDKYYHQLINKRLNAPNIVNQLQMKYQKQLKSFKQPFSLALRNRRIQQGIAVNLVVMEVHHISNKNYYLLELSDGWYSFYVPIKQQSRIKNNSYYLTNLIKKDLIYPGVKIQTYGWYQYPIKGILLYLDCPNPFPCLQIQYNSLIKIPQSSKLGISTQLYYKQVSKCHPQCGLVSIYSLYLIRIIVDYKLSKVWFRLANKEQSYLLHIADGLGLLDEYKEKQWYDCTNLKIINRFEFQNSRITKMLKIDNVKGFHYVMKEMLWNICEVKNPYKPCDLLIKIEEIDQDEIRGFDQKKQIVISIKDAKINITDMNIKEYKIITEVVYLTEVAGYERFKATSMSKVVGSSTHALYQGMLDLRNKELNK